MSYPQTMIGYSQNVVIFMQKWMGQFYKKEQEIELRQIKGNSNSVQN